MSLHKINWARPIKLTQKTFKSAESEEQKKPTKNAAKMLTMDVMGVKKKKDVDTKHQKHRRSEHFQPLCGHASGDVGEG